MISDDDAPLPRFVGIPFPDISLEVDLDVFRKRIHVNAQKDRIGRVGGNGHAVAALHQNVQAARNGVFSRRIDVLAVDPRVLHATLAREPLQRRIVVLKHYRRGDVCPHGIAHTLAHLQKSTAFFRLLHGTDFQHVQNVLPRHLQGAQLIHVRVHGNQIAVGHRARRDVRTDAAAVDRHQIAHQTAVRREIQHGVGAQIAQVRLLLAGDPTQPIVAEAAQQLLGRADRRLLLLLHLALELRHQLGDGRILAAPLLDKLSRHAVDARRIQRGRRRAVSRVDLDASEALELRARLRDDDVLASLVLHRLDIHLVAVAVHDDVDSARMGDHGVASPLPDRAGFPQVRHQHDVVGLALVARLIDSGLHGVVELLAALVAAEAVDDVAVFVLETVGRGRSERGRRGRADERDAHPAGSRGIFQHAIRVEDAGAARIQIIAAHVRHALGLAQGEELLLAVVEFMVARNEQVVAAGADDLGRGFALRERTLETALHIVAGIDQLHVGLAVFLALRFGVVDERRVPELGFRVGKLAVHVVGVQDDDGGRRGAVRGSRSRQSVGKRRSGAGSKRDGEARQDDACAGKESAAGNILASR